MPRAVLREEVQELSGSGAQLVEVLPKEEYRWRHLSGAVSLPLRGLSPGQAATLDASRPVIVYCNDFQ